MRHQRRGVSVVKVSPRQPIAAPASVKSGRHRQNRMQCTAPNADPITSPHFALRQRSQTQSSFVMQSTIQIAVIAAAFVQAATAYSSYMELIPNGESIGKPLGHKDSGYTDFGTLFSDSGTEWSKVCSETWPGGSVTCGEALGDPCCTWKSGAPDYTLTEPNTDGTTCASASTATSGAATSTAASGADAETTEASGTTDDTETQASNTTDSTAAVTDSSEYCE